MADRYQKGQVAKQFNRNSDVEISTERREQIMGLALAHAASGNDHMFQLLFNTMAKTTTQAELQADVAETKALVAKLINSLAK